MNVSLPAELERFVKERIKSGLYKDEGDLVGAALRGLKEREEFLPRMMAAGSPAAGSTAASGGLAAIGFTDADIEAIAFIVLMEAAQSANEDLKAIMAEVKAMTGAKKKMRELLGKVQKDAAKNAGQSASKKSLVFGSGGIGSERDYHRVQLPYPDPAAEGGVKFVETDLHRESIDSVEILESISDELRGKLYSMSELSEMSSLRLQMVMDRRAKLMSTLSNMMKKISDTQQSIVQNLK